MSFELFLALRYLREGRSQTAFILAGATMGIAILVFVTALVDGLQRSFIRQTLSSQAHILVKVPERAPRVLASPDGAGLLAHVEKAPDRLRSIAEWQQALEAIERIPGVVAATPTVAGSAFATRGEATKAVALRGVVGESFGEVLDLSDRITQGDYRPAGTDAVIGSVLAADLGVEVGDKVRLVAPDGRADLFTVRGVFDLGNRDVNQRWVLVSLHAAQSLLDLAGGATTIEVRVDDVFAAERIAGEIAARADVTADSWMKTNAQLLVALRSQAMSGYIIQSLVIAAVALGIASVLGVSVIQKSREIGLLKATGTSTRRILRVFLIQGGIVGLAGSVGGSLLGVLMAALFAQLARRPNGEPLFPVELRPGLFLLATSVAVVTGLVAASLPARRAASLDPAVVIRHG
jgi:lipoprotein-releasing system permease protein